ncbi:MAG: hypothetical protein ABR501_05665 [Pyrinomonadaceae bacterium]
MNQLIKYFDLASGTDHARNRAATDQPKTLHWLPQYIALVLGVIVQPFLAAYQQSGSWHVTGLAGRIVFAAITGLIVFPAVYRRAFDPEKPIFVQFCTIFAAGLGWESLLRSAVKAAGQVTGVSTG